MTQFLSQNRDTQICIDQCLKCYEVCTRTLAAGLEINEEQDFITTLQLCAQTCQLASQSLLLDSAFYVKICSLCADLCDEAAKICQNFDEEEMRHCGEVLRNCEEALRRLLAHPVTGQGLQPDIRLV